MGDYRSITKDRYRVIDQLCEVYPAKEYFHTLTNEELTEAWDGIKGYALRYVGDDLFQCVEYK